MPRWPKERNKGATARKFSPSNQKTPLPVNQMPRFFFFTKVASRCSRRKTTCAHVCVHVCVTGRVRCWGQGLAWTCTANSCKRLFWSSAASRRAPPHAIMTTSLFLKEIHFHACQAIRQIIDLRTFSLYKIDFNSIYTLDCSINII